jgi:hypothetical protein
VYVCVCVWKRGMFVCMYVCSIVYYVMYVCTYDV